MDNLLIISQEKGIRESLRMILKDGFLVLMGTAGIVSIVSVP